MEKFSFISSLLTKNQKKVKEKKDEKAVGLLFKQGISRLKDYKLIVHPKCENLIIELNNYAWKKDKDTEKLLNEPIDEFNHLMDALRYATEGVRVRSFRF